MTGEVEITGAAWEAVFQHARDTWPDECCGLLIGQRQRVLEAHRAANSAAERQRRFLIDPADHFAAIRRARRAGLEVIGAYHSHPDGEPVPSATDRSEAFEAPDFISLIVVPPCQGRTAAVGAYRFALGNFVALRLVRIP